MILIVISNFVDTIFLVFSYHELAVVGDNQAGTVTPLPSPRGGDGEGGTSNGKDGGQPGASLEARSPASVTGEREGSNPYSRHADVPGRQGRFLATWHLSALTKAANVGMYIKFLGLYRIC